MVPHRLGDGPTEIRKGVCDVPHRIHSRNPMARVQNDETLTCREVPPLLPACIEFGLLPESTGTR